MRVLQLGALLVLVFMPSTQLVWLGRLNPKQLLGPWYLLAVASHEKGFMVEKNTKYVEGVMVTLTPENNLKVLSTRHGSPAGPPHTSLHPQLPQAASSGHGGCSVSLSGDAGDSRLPARIPGSLNMRERGQHQLHTRSPVAHVHAVEEGFISPRGPWGPCPPGEPLPTLWSHTLDASGGATLVTGIHPLDLSSSLRPCGGLLLWGLALFHVKSLPLPQTDPAGALACSMWTWVSGQVTGSGWHLPDSLSPHSRVSWQLGHQGDPSLQPPGRLTKQGRGEPVSSHGSFLSRLEGCTQNAMELSRQSSRWVFENPVLAWSPLEDSRPVGMARAGRMAPEVLVQLFTGSCRTCLGWELGASPRGEKSLTPRQSMWPSRSLPLMPDTCGASQPRALGSSLGAESRVPAQWLATSLETALGVLQYRVLGTNFRDYAIVLTQMEVEEEAFNTLELYSEWRLSGGHRSKPLCPRPLCWGILAAGPPRVPGAVPLPQAGWRWPAGRPCSSSPNGAGTWASYPSSRPSCRRTVSVLKWPGEVRQAQCPQITLGATSCFLPVGDFLEFPPSQACGMVGDRARHSGSSHSWPRLTFQSPVHAGSSSKWQCPRVPVEHAPLSSQQPGGGVGWLLPEALAPANKGFHKQTPLVYLTGPHSVHARQVEELDRSTQEGGAP
ncbi:Hypothetical predicted protein [Marmota monax]|uniref:Lipocalin/cytosolic fatty-acid binding domain-containing protein n=1 Tax=Marmota monax TaxID=9995 RepID=A0A5E4AAP7_MARMO|nr:Hypothetical predicted protein [Marmota monax]